MDCLRELSSLLDVRVDSNDPRDPSRDPLDPSRDPLDPLDPLDPFDAWLHASSVLAASVSSTRDRRAIASVASGAAGSFASAEGSLGGGGSRPRRIPAAAAWVSKRSDSVHAASASARAGGSPGAAAAVVSGDGSGALDASAVPPAAAFLSPGGGGPTRGAPSSRARRSSSASGTPPRRAPAASSGSLSNRGVFDWLTLTGRFRRLLPAHRSAALAASSVSNSTNATLAVFLGFPWTRILDTAPAAVSKNPRICSSVAPMSMFAAYTVRAHRSTSSGVCGRSCGFTGMTLVRLRTTRIGLPPISVPDMRSAASAALGAPNATNAKYPSELESAHKRQSSTAPHEANAPETSSSVAAACNPRTSTV